MTAERAPTAISSELIATLGRAQTVTVMTGAGVSAESGIATFRDRNDGLWANYRPEDLATPEAFERNPDIVWNWYQWRREQLSLVQPNPAHRALAALECRYRDFTLVTQNVDRLHHRAGSRRVIELHGNIIETICHRTRRLIELEAINDASFVPPRSPYHPEGLARPNVVWFGEALPASALNDATAASACDVFISIGTSSVVQPAASLAVLAKDQGAALIEINPEATPLTGFADFVLTAAAGVCLPQIVERLNRHHPKD